MPIWLNNDYGPEAGGGPGLLVAEVQRANGTWVDITTDAMAYPSQGVIVQAAGRQTELSRGDDGLLALVVDNRSGDYTPGYASAPTSFFLGMQVRVRETVGRRSQYLFTGFMNQPEALYNGPNDESVVVTCVDWSGSQQQGRKFISNLGEWVVYNGGDALAEYWPMIESARPFQPVKDSTMPAISSRVFASSAEPADGDARIAAASGVMPLGEDSRIPVIGGPLDGGGIPAFAYHLGANLLEPGVTASIPIAVGQVMTAVVWIDPVEYSSLQEITRLVLVEEPGGGTTLLTLTKASVGAPMTLDAVGGALTGTITGSGLDTGIGAYPIAFRHGTTTSVYELWLGRKRFTGSLTGTPPAGGYSFGSVSSGAFWYQGSWGHLQLYVGAEADYTFTDYLAQIEHVNSALTGGYARQRTDERIRTVARYAGLSDSQLDLDRGVACMPRASLAGRTYTQLRDEAVATEQGRAFTGSDGNLVFHNRARTRYAV